VATLTPPIPEYPVNGAYNNPVSFTANTDETLDFLMYGWQYRRSGQTIQVRTQDAIPREATFDPSGTRMYVSGDTNNRIYQYGLTRPWDLGTASYASKSMLTSGEFTGAQVRGQISQDGGTMWVNEYNATIWQYTLTTPFDVSTGSYASKSYTPSEPGTFRNFWVNPAGDTLYCCGTQTIYRYTLGTAGDISTASYASESGSVATQITVCVSFCLSDDESKLFALDNAANLYEYALTTPGDISSISYQSNSLDPGSDVATMANESGVWVGNDGRNVYITDIGTGTGDDAVFQWYIPVAWSLATTQYENVGSGQYSYNINTNVPNPTGVSVHPSGTKYWFAESSGGVYEYTTSNAFEIRGMSYNGSDDVSPPCTTPYDIRFGNAGNKFFVLENSGYIYRFSPTSAYELGLSSDYDTGNYLDLTSETTDARSMCFTSDGTTVFVLDEDGSQVLSYSGTAWDLTTFSYDTGSDFDTSPYATGEYDIVMAPDDTGFYFRGSLTGGIHYVYMTTAGDLSTAVYGEQILDTGDWTGVAPSLFGHIASTGHKMYTFASTNDYFCEWERDQPDTALGNMATLSHALTYRLVGTLISDTYALNVRVVCGSKILAAANSGGTFASVDSNVTNTSYTTSSATAFAYVNTSATRNDWNNAKIEVQQDATLSTVDGCYIQVDLVALTGTYTEAATDLGLKFCGTAFSALSKILGVDDSTFAKFNGSTGA